MRRIMKRIMKRINQTNRAKNIRRKKLSLNAKLKKVRIRKKKKIETIINTCTKYSKS